MTSLETQTHTHPLCSHAANDFELFIIVFPLKFAFQMTASCGWFLEQSSHMINGIIFMVLLGLDQFIQFRVYRRMLKISINAVFYIFSGQQLNATISNCDVSYLYILTFNWHNRHNRPKITKCILFPLLFNFYFLDNYCFIFCLLFITFYTPDSVNLQIYFVCHAFAIFNKKK